MNIIAVDDEQPALNILTKAIGKAVPDCSLAAFTTAEEAIAHAREVKPDVAFLDIKMPGVNGLELAKRFKEIYGKTNIIFVTGYSQYATDAFGIRVSGYLMKPATPEAVLRELEQLRHPVEPPEKGVRVRCFGSFGVFIDGKPLLFSRRKVKELLAFLVHKRGAVVSTAEIAALLWEDREYTSSVKSYTQNVISQLMKTLKSAGIEDVVVKSWNSMAVDVTKISCDYYDYQDSKMDAAYAGEYMNEYSWAEFTAAYISAKMK